jgi:hypothetical protein
MLGGVNLTDEIPPPWRLTDTGSAFKISDARGRGVAWVYYARTDALKAEYLTREQALEMARAIARLSRPEAPGG